VTKREQLEAALAKAEAALANAVINAAKVHGARAEANANLDKARAHCRRLCAALVALKRPAPIGFRCLDLSCDLLF
jgi:multidrug resistance efflux pump